MVKFWVFLASCLVFGIAPWLILRQQVIVPQTAVIGWYIAGIVFVSHLLLIVAVLGISKKMNNQGYVWPIIIPLLFWMIVGVAGVVYIGYTNGRPVKNYTFYQICNPNEDGEFCACKMEYVYKNLPYLFDTQNQYQRMAIINEHVSDLEYGIRECQKKFGIEPPATEK